MSDDGKTSDLKFRSHSHERLVNLDKLKQEIVERLSIDEVASRLCDVDLVVSGVQYRGLCPLHEEATPSFYVHPGRNAFHCFGCKQGGDAIALVQMVYHADFREALEILANEAGIDIQQYVRPATPEEKERDKLRSWCEAYVAQLSPCVQRTSEQTSRVLGIGVPQRAKHLPHWLHDKQYLLSGEVLFPYRTASGKLVGWKVRHADKKMFRTPNDFPLTEPAIWGLDVAREHVDDELIVVEGEWDCAVLHDHGVQNVAAMGGGKWTDEQLQILLDLHIKRVVFFVDGDKAGTEAANSIATRYWRHPHISINIAQAWSGADPEDMARALGGQAIREQVAKARGALEWLLWQEWSSRPNVTLSQKMDFVRWIQEHYGTQLIGVEQTLVLQQVAEWMQVPQADVLDFARTDKTQLQAPESERVILGRSIRDGNYFMQVRKRIVKDDLYVIKHQRVWETLTDMMADGLDFDVTTVRRRAEGQGVTAEFVDELAAVGDINIGWHEDQIIDLSIRRGSKADADYFREVVGDLSVPANQLIGTLTHRVTSKALGRGRSVLQSTVEQVDDAMNTLHERMRNPDAVIGLSLGSQFPQLTQLLQGVQRRRLMTIAARSGVGKSTIVIQWLVGMAVQQAIPCDFISLEMDPDEILFKAAAHLTGIDSMKVSAGRLVGEEIMKVEQAMARIRKSPFRIYAPDDITPSEVLLFARESVMERRTEVFALDFIQQVGPDPEVRKLGRYEQLGDASYIFKQKVCRGLDVGMIIIAQLRRELANAEEPTPEDMGDSYHIVRASDSVILLNEVDNGHEIWVGKNRGGAGSQLLPATFNAPACTWHEANAPKLPDYAAI